MERLICTEISARLGTGGATEVKGHEWFKEVVWHTLWQQPAVFLPTTKDIEDTTYFDDRGVAGVSLPSYQDSGSEFDECMDDQGSDFGESVYKNLGVLERANQKIVSKIKEDYPMGENWHLKRHDSMPVSSPITVPSQIMGRIAPPHTRFSSAGANLSPYTLQTSPSTYDSFSSHINLRPSPLRSRRSSSNNSQTRLRYQDSHENFEMQTDSLLDVLVAVEDGNHPNNLIQSILTTCGCLCTCVKNGAEAAQLAMGDTQYDFIFVSHTLHISMNYLI